MSRSKLIEEAVRDHLRGPGQFMEAMKNPTLRATFASLFGQPAVVRGLADVIGKDVKPAHLAGLGALLGQGATMQAVTGGGNVATARRGRSRSGHSKTIRSKSGNRGP